MPMMLTGLFEESIDVVILIDKFPFESIAKRSVIEDILVTWGIVT